MNKFDEWMQELQKEIDLGKIPYPTYCVYSWYIQ